MLKLSYVDDRHHCDRLSDAQIALEKLKEFGAILIDRVGDVEDFISFTNNSTFSFRPYVGSGVPRLAVNEDPTIMNVNSPGDFGGSSLHGEQYYLSRPPEVLYFYCQKKALVGGHTLLCKGDEILSALPSVLAHRFETQQITYVRELSVPDIGLMQIDDPKSLTDWKMSPAQNGRIKTEFTTTAIKVTPDGRRNFINSILPILFDFEDARPMMKVRFEDGTWCDKLMGKEILDATRTCQASMQLQEGQVLVVNRWMLHGRTPFQGHRSMLTRMAEFPY